MNQRMADNENIIEQWELGAEGQTPVPVADKSVLDKAIDANIEARMADDNALRSITSKVIQAEEQGLPGSEAYNLAATEGRGIEGTDAAQEYIKDFGKVLTQIGVMETLGGINRVLPTTGLGTADPDYYGIIDAPASVFGHAIKSKLGIDTKQEERSGITIPWGQFNANPRFKEHMIELEMQAHYNAAKDISPGLGAALKHGQQSQDYSDFNEMFDGLIKETAIQSSTGVDDQGLGQKLQNFIDGTWRMGKFDESGENVIINKLPQIDEGLFGFDMVLDPYFSKKGDLVLPGEGVFGMRDGELVQLGSSMSRPLDEMFMEGTTPGLDEYLAENVTDKLAFQGPEMLQPKDTGMGYSHGMMAALARGIGWPLLRGGYKAGKAGYNLAKGSPAKSVQKIEPYIYEGILQNIK